MIPTTEIPAMSPDKHTAKVTHPRIVRITHWINAVAMIVMIGSGWRIFNDSPLIEGFIFPPAFTIGGDPDVSWVKYQNGAYGALQWHFAAMWVLFFNGLVYLIYGFVSGRFKALLLPITVDGVRSAIVDALNFKLDHSGGVYNHVQRLLYIGVLCLAVLVVLSGLAIWKPVQFQTLASLFISFQGARWVHFLCMIGIVLFLIVHVTLALLVPKTIVSMVKGSGHDDAHSKTDMKRS
jgi:thiosulfate reductase cytochrome b subunit